MSIHFHQLTVKEVKKETPACVSVVFDVPEELIDSYRFTSGQNLTIRFLHNEEEVRRNYSICSCPFDHELRIAIKQVEGGRFSAFANSSLKKGDVLDVLPPTGKFFTLLDPAQTKNYVAFAAGSGITPVISIIRSTLLTEPHSRFTLIYGNQNRANIIFRETLEELKNRYIDRFQLIHILSREKTDIPLFSGRIDREKCRILSEKIIHLPAVDEFFLCGPEEMIFTVRDFLIENKVPSGKIHFELFSTPDSKKSSGETKRISTTSDEKSTVTVQLDGISTTFELGYDGETILNAALRQGIDLPYACKGGVCSTCRAKLLEGRVEMENNYSLEEDEIAAGFILTCQSHPRSEKVAVNFDVR